MLPTLLPGESVRARRRLGRLGIGEVVVVRDPSDGGRWLIKRVSALTKDRVELRGDNPEFSTDSRHFGDVARREVGASSPHGLRSQA